MTEPEQQLSGLVALHRVSNGGRDWYEVRWHCPVCSAFGDYEPQTAEPPLDMDGSRSRWALSMLLVGGTALSAHLVEKHDMVRRPDDLVERGLKQLDLIRVADSGGYRACCPLCLWQQEARPARDAWNAPMREPASSVKLRAAALLAEHLAEQHRLGYVASELLHAQVLPPGPQVGTREFPPDPPVEAVSARDAAPTAGVVHLADRRNALAAAAHKACPDCGNVWWRPHGVVIDADSGSVTGYGWPLVCIECNYQEGNP